jgi:hypothetical protein
MTLLIDVGDVPDAVCTHCIDLMAKAMSEDPAGDGRSIWTPHDNPWLAAHVEDVTARMALLLNALRDAFAAVLSGDPLLPLLRKSESAPWLRWDATAFERVRARLEGKAPARYTLDDWMDLVDYLIHTYLPDGVIQSEAEYLTVRASLIGKIQDAMESGRGPANRADIPYIVDLLPMRFGLIPDKILTPVELATIHFAKSRAAIDIGDLSDRARSAMRTMIIEHVQAQMLGMQQGRYTALRSRLFDAYGQLNRDFRRIAVTEAGECANQGFIAAQKHGTYVRRVEAYRGVCDFCASINGKVFEVVSPATAATADGQTQVWVGKSNVGRSAATRKKTGLTMVDRADSEKLWPAAGVQHPNCRGSWVAVASALAEVSDAFLSWMAARIAAAAPREFTA